MSGCCKDFRVEAGVPPGFGILDDDEAAELRIEAINRTLAEAGKKENGALGEALRAAVRHAADERFDQLLRAALAERPWLNELSDRQLLHDAGLHDALPVHYRKLFDVRDDVDRDKLHEEMSEVLTANQLELAAAALAKGGKRDQFSFCTIECCRICAR